MVQEQWAFMVHWRSGAIQRVVATPHVEEARGEAERLAKLGE